MDQAKILTHQFELEQAGEEVLSAKQEIIDLDRKRNQNREALTAMRQDESDPQTSDKQWIVMGNCFFKLPRNKAKELLQKDQERLDEGIEKLRSDLKDKVNNLRDKEGQNELKGFGLKAMSAQETQAFKQILH